MLKGEKEAISLVLKWGRIYGFGNLISWLKREWALQLVNNWSIGYEEALKAADADAQPKEADIEKL